MYGLLGHLSDTCNRRSNKLALLQNLESFVEGRDKREVEATHLLWKVKKSWVYWPCKTYPPLQVECGDSINKLLFNIGKSSIVNSHPKHEHTPALYIFNFWLPVKAQESTE